MRYVNIHNSNEFNQVIRKYRQTESKLFNGETVIKLIKMRLNDTINLELLQNANYNEKDEAIKNVRSLKIIGRFTEDEDLFKLNHRNNGDIDIDICKIQ